MAENQSPTAVVQDPQAIAPEAPEQDAAPAVQQTTVPAQATAPVQETVLAHNTGGERPDGTVGNQM